MIKTASRHVRVSYCAHSLFGLCRITFSSCTFIHFASHALLFLTLYNGFNSSCFSTFHTRYRCSRLPRERCSRSCKCRNDFGCHYDGKPSSFCRCQHRWLRLRLRHHWHLQHRVDLRCSQPRDWATADAALRLR